MQDDTFIFLDEFSDTELYVFLNKSKEKILKFIWKEKKIEIIGKYQEQQESNYSNEEPFDLAEIGYDSVVYKVLSKIEEDDLKSAEFEDWDGCLVIEISIYNYPDEIRNLDNEIIWTKENIKKEHMDIINQKNKKLEEQKKRGREYFKYLDELEILRREKVNTPKREEELIKKIEEREEAGKRYAEYKRNLKKWIKHMKKYLKNNEYIY
ncbi:hypothetical protein CBG60_02835 [Fusobacterium animalis]|uniref:Uncharacterized protein n=1 Tax=Fusobacterium animalis 7_1 TaxID=457405 RepID=A0A140PTV9_9FUSO|nr:MULTISPECIES: hypothetical protein [Fusobacterium]ASG30285.1 hypothetical protein CBG60_02835 [Fusobacterium animalis]EEO43607.1 hypothetical protein FSDG_02166 [Fusobacterium animalis 7_1]EHG17980.2 hypothetical protein HMPREF9369_01801 [Fusobacterium polymorphum F0401]ERT37878.1 hypothetical protein HMPREF1540_00426 [Fusobacterium nucleatum CTI-3]ERT42090.1 hypothetical protein HMPREF1538_00695 [Fusobacterium nucleatum CTI-1]